MPEREDRKGVMLGGAGMVLVFVLTARASSVVSHVSLTQQKRWRAYLDWSSLDLVRQSMLRCYSGGCEDRRDEAGSNRQRESRRTHC